MERVTDSVQQILRSCDSMVEEAKDVEFVDIWSLANTLKLQCAELQRIFDESPDNEKLLQAQKQKVESTAIRLEFFMAVRLGVYKDRYNLRQYAKKMYDDCKLITLQMAKDSSIDGITINEWGARTQWALKFYSRSLHVLFDTNDEDDKKIKEIVEGMKNVKGVLTNAG